MEPEVLFNYKEAQICFFFVDMVKDRKRNRNKMVICEKVGCGKHIRSDNMNRHLRGHIRFDNPSEVPSSEVPPSEVPILDDSEKLSDKSVLDEDAEEKKIKQDKKRIHRRGKMSFDVEGDGDIKEKIAKRKKTL